jgi:hypothetical protein
MARKSLKLTVFSKKIDSLLNPFGLNKKHTCLLFTMAIYNLAPVILKTHKNQKPMLNSGPKNLPQIPSLFRSFLDPPGK